MHIFNTYFLNLLQKLFSGNMVGDSVNFQGDWTGDVSCCLLLIVPKNTNTGLQILFPNPFSKTVNLTYIENHAILEI